MERNRIMNQPLNTCPTCEEKIHQNNVISSEIVHQEYNKKLALGDRLADKITSFGGSWSFLISFGIFLFIWMWANSVMNWWTPSDPYPFIFLNLILSCIAAIQAPIIMMSQNRQEAKDRIHAQYDYQINLKAELEIRNLHKKIDRLLAQQHEKIIEIQATQTKLLEKFEGRTFD